MYRVGSVHLCILLYKFHVHWDLLWHGGISLAVLVGGWLRLRAATCIVCCCRIGLTWSLVEPVLTEDGRVCVQSSHRLAIPLQHDPATLG